MVHNNHNISSSSNITMLSSLSLLPLLLSLLPLTSSNSPNVVIGIDGGTESIRACCFNAHTGHILGKSCAIPYPTSHPQPGWAEQDPHVWYDCLVHAVRGAVASLNVSNPHIRALCCDTTCCSVVALSDQFVPLRPSLLWMDARSASQAGRIMTVAAAFGESVVESFPELRVNSDGEGPISAEWMLPKAMWIKECEPQVWKDAEIICEYQDYLNYRLTRRMVASSCNAAVRWHHDGWEVREDSREHAGRPMRLYKALGIEELAEKLPKRTLAMGDVVGGLCKEAADDLGISEGTLVVQGGPDAFVGMIGLGTIHPHQLCLITGSSHLHCLITPHATSRSGMWGAYRGAPLPHLNFAEGGQSSTGSLVRWFRDVLLLGGRDEDGTMISYRVLDDEASNIPPGSDGLVALETWQGSRTPNTDPLARGAFVGLTLSHTRAHIFRAILEAVCFGTRSCIDALETAADPQASCDGGSVTHKSKAVVIAGGVTRSPLWLQLHADICGRTLLLNENPDGPLLGCAILASVGSGIYCSVEEAVKNMVRVKGRIEPREETRRVYDRLYRDVYLKMRPSVTGLFHALAEVRGGGDAFATEHQTFKNKPKSIIVSPSILAADWTDIKGEIQQCINIGLTHIHLDVFDGVFLDSPYALTFGPQMVQAIRRRFDHPHIVLDVHLCVSRPLRYVEAMAAAGASRVIFQWEAMEGQNPLQSAVEFARYVTGSGMKCGVSINPQTDLRSIFPLLETGLLDMVDILAVEPGFGGQSFNPLALEKISQLREWRDAMLGSFAMDVIISVDGGINGITSKEVTERGADILVVGTSLFGHPLGLIKALEDLNLS